MLLTLDCDSLSIVLITWIPLADRRAVAQTCGRVLRLYRRHHRTSHALYSGPVVTVEPYCTESLMTAARCGSAGLVNYLLSIGCHPSPDMAYAAASRGHLDIVRRVTHVVEWHTLAHVFAVNRCIAGLEWVFEVSGLQRVHDDTVTKCVYYDLTSILVWLDDRARLPRSSIVLEVAARVRRLDILDLFRARGYPWSAMVMSEAVHTADVGFVAQLQERGCPCDGHATSCAGRGHGGSDTTTT